MTKQIDELMALAHAIAMAARNGNAFKESAALRTALEAALKPVGPVAWQVHPFDYGIGHEGVYARTSLPQQVDAWERKGWRVQPLYTAAPPAQTPVEPAMNGWKLVPVEPTDEMLLATIATAGNYTKEQMLAWPEVSETRTNWAAMLDAAPPAQTPPPINTETHEHLSTLIGLFLGKKEKIGYLSGSVIDKAVNEAIEHLKDWPYPPPPRLTDDEVLQLYIHLNSENHPELNSPSNMFTWIFRAIESAVRKQFGVNDE